MKLALIGGNGHHFLKAAADDPKLDVQVVAISSDGVDARAAGKHCETFAEAIWYDCPQTMLDKVKPDVVSVGAVYAWNGRLAAECLERDIPVVADKPVATTWEDLEHLEMTAAKSKAQLATEFDFRSRASMRSACQLVRDGAIGEPALVSSQKSYPFGSRPAWYADREQYGGTLLWIASHGIDAVEFISGCKIVEACGVSGNLSRRDWPAFEDHTVTMFKLDNGGTAVTHADFLRSPKAGSWGDDRVRIAGTQGVIEVRDGVCTLQAADAAPSDQSELVQPVPLHRELLASVLGGGSEWFGTRQSLASARTLLAARDATDQRKWVPVPTGPIGKPRSGE